MYGGRIGGEGRAVAGGRSKFKRTSGSPSASTAGRLPPSGFSRKKKEAKKKQKIAKKRNREGKAARGRGDE